MRNLVKYTFSLYILIISQNIYSQKIANYVTNGGFEEKYSCSGFNYIELAKGWVSIDSLNTPLYYYCECLNNVPFDGFTYQQPRSGKCFGETTFFCFSPPCPIDNNRSYFKNRLKYNLIKGVTYCVKYFVNVTNYSSVGIDGFGAFFADTNIDTITKSLFYLPYLIPQVINPANNVITDTLNWVPITGSFTANGNEKYMVIGNFRSNASTSTISIQTNTPNTPACDINLDDVSCIPFDLSAYAGPDKSCKIGDSVYVGRERDFAIDPGCTWFQLPNMSVPIATASGIWVKPTVTTTYVVKQILDCSALKYDTVVVYADLVGLPGVSSSGVENDIGFFPNPATNKITFEYKDELQLQSISIKNIIGQQVLQFIEPKKEIDISFLSTGIHYLRVETNKGNKTFKLQKE